MACSVKALLVTAAVANAVLLLLLFQGVLGFPDLEASGCLWGAGKERDRAGLPEAPAAATEGAQPLDPCSSCVNQWYDSWSRLKRNTSKPFPDVILSEAESGEWRAVGRAAAAGHKRTFFYPDGLDDSIAELVRALESRLEGKDFEQEYWANLDVELGARRGGAFLDAGAGLGRITLRYANLFQRTVALEPDPARFAVLQRFVAKFLPRPDRVALVQGFLQDVPDKEGTFDVVVSNHVVQHIAVPVAAAYFRRLRLLLKPQGVLLVSTTLFPRSAYGFEIAGKAFRAIDESEFNAVAFNPHSKVLPLRRFTRPRLQRELEEAGLRPLRWFGFSFWKPEAARLLAGRYGIPEELMLDTPVSQCFVLQRRG